MANSSVTITYGSLGEHNQYDVVTIDWVGDDVNGTVPSTPVVLENAGVLMLAVTNPGVGPPQANYNITLVSALDGMDAMGGGLLLRHTTNSEQALPKIATVAAPLGRIVAGTLTFALADNNVASATGQCTLYIKR